MKYITMVFLCLGLGGLVCWGDDAATPQRLPVPSVAEMGKMQTLVRDTYKPEYGKGTAGRLHLATVLIDEAMKPSSEGDPTMRFVMLREARDLAVDAGDFTVAQSAIEAMSTYYSVDKQDMKLALLVAAKSSRSASGPVTAAPLAMQFAAEALAKDDFKEADKYSRIAQEFAERSRDNSLVVQVQEQAADIRAQKADWSRVRSAAEKLQNAPDDPQANFIVGKRICFSKGDWEKGAPYLEKGTDQKLAALAKIEESKPAGADAITAADAWWDYALDHATPTPFRAIALRRAEHWYTVALPPLTGFKGQHAEQRIVEAAKANRCVFLTELNEKGFEGIVTDFGWGVGKDVLNSSIRKPIVVNDIHYTHAISINPLNTTTAKITYALGGKYARFAGGIGIYDGGHADGVLVFKVVGNGRELWKSEPYQTPRVVQFFDVDVLGVDTLQIQVVNSGTAGGCNTVWVDPRLMPR